MWRFLKKLQIELPYNPAIPLLGIYTEDRTGEKAMEVAIMDNHREVRGVKPN